MEWNRIMRQVGAAVICLLGGSAFCAGAEPTSYVVDSEYQPAPQRVHVLLPDDLDLSDTKPDRTIRILYILPVEPASEMRWGDPVKETVKAGIANRHQVVCVFPEFAQLPWYADHPTDKTIRQESYLLKSVIPFVDEQLSVKETQVERYLVGFSKSGWGAFTLLLRHPDKFKKAAAWDAPLMMYHSGLYGSGPIFGNSENFQRYEISSLLEKRKRQFQDSPRLISLGYDNFRSHLLQFHKLADELKVPHVHRDGPQRRHHWESGWLREAVDLLLSDKQE
jgi:hypothetical protein